MKFKRVAVGIKQYNNEVVKINKNDETSIEDLGKNNENKKIDNKEKYRDEYGKIKHVDFNNDEELIGDLNLGHFFKDIDNEKDINNINNEKEINTILIDDENEAEEKKEKEEKRKRGN